MGQGLCLVPAQKGRGSMWKGGPLECGVLEFGGRALSGGVWVGFRPSALEVVSEGVSECRGAALGGGVGRGLGPAWQEGGSEGRGLGFLVPKWTGKALAPFPSLPSCPSPTVSPRASPIHAGPLTVGGSRWL